jgi:ribosomal protein L37E
VASVNIPVWQLLGEPERKTRKWHCDRCGVTRWGVRPQACSRCRMPMSGA